MGENLFRLFGAGALGGSFLSVGEVQIFCRVRLRARLVGWMRRRVYAFCKCRFIPPHQSLTRQLPPRGEAFLQESFRTTQQSDDRSKYTHPHPSPTAPNCSRFSSLSKGKAHKCLANFKKEGFGYLHLAFQSLIRFQHFKAKTKEVCTIAFPL